jgi:phosphoribosylamine--glycine ligase
MKVLIVGKGGREHALAWKFAQSDLVEQVFVAPGNEGISLEKKCILVNAITIEQIFNFAKDEKIDLTFVGSEDYLANGIVDKFQEANLTIIGPEKKSARLESSKIFSKQFMKRNNIQTANFEIFENSNEAINYAKTINYPVVIKADGLASGKGVFICNHFNEACDAVKSLMEESKFLEAGKKIVIEDYLNGFEASLFLVLDGNNYKILTYSKDHKKLLNGDKGPNTGGLGAITPHPDINERMKKLINEKIIIPTVEGLRKEDLFYKGILYIGLLIENGEPYVLEYNVRLGDPEAQSILYLLKSDLVDLCKGIIETKIINSEIEWHNGYSLCLVLCSKGYPLSYKKGEKITFQSNINSKIFFSGVKKEGMDLLTDGGRVLSIVNRSETLEKVREVIYEDAQKIDFESKYYRSDL